MAKLRLNDRLLYFVSALISLPLHFFALFMLIWFGIPMLMYLFLNTRISNEQRWGDGVYITVVVIEAILLVSLLVWTIRARRKS